MIAFQACLDGCELQDLYWRGYRFTWSKKQVGAGRVEERLDKFCTNERWLCLIEHWQVDHLFSIGSDHAILKLQFAGLSNHKLSARRWGRRFYFEEQWLRHAECKEIIKSNWGADFFSSVRRVTENLNRWNKIRTTASRSRKSEI